MSDRQPLNQRPGQHQPLIRVEQPKALSTDGFGGKELRIYPDSGVNLEQTTIIETIGHTPRSQQPADQPNTPTT
ncbi:hypothetical protein [Mycobacterium lacus]|uniref:hypothetical protein n=1 Tax=Mycobacterium lacus TaxID=169765 RepID=UPI000A166A56|nr:hypothetical protein [Mycobacterium lacus]MCV7125895.1 hypothetical protein [Mycobacterium lacus]ORW14236.1 hypothetical protein AWC15_13790 [Mycobacterium lacus]